MKSTAAITHIPHFEFCLRINKSIKQITRKLIIKEYKHNIFRYRQIISNITGFNGDPYDEKACLMDRETFSKAVV